MNGEKASTKFLKECMADAILELMKTKPVEKITVIEITTLAGVGRATWFRNFKSKREALAFKVEVLIERAACKNNLSQWREYSAENARVFFEFIYEIREICTRLCEAGQKSALFLAFYNVFMPDNNSSDIFDKYSSKFYVCGLFGLVDEWIKRGFAESPDELAKMVLKMTSHSKTV